MITEPLITFIKNRPLTFAGLAVILSGLFPFWAGVPILLLTVYLNWVSNWNE